MWEQNEINGYGMIQWKDGRHYIGQWKRGNMHGFGKYVWAD